MTFDSWSAIDSGDSVIRNRKITTVVLSVWSRNIVGTLLAMLWLRMATDLSAYGAPSLGRR